MIMLKTPVEIEKVAAAARVVADVLESLREHVRPGVTTADLDRLAEEAILREGGKPAFKGYHGYPATLCTSVNEQVVHCIPRRETVLKEGDIVGLDLGVYRDGYYGDAAVTLPVGRISAEAQRLLEATEGALYEGIQAAVPGKRVSDISAAVQSFAEARGFSVVTDFVGHGIGRDLHEDPQVPNFGPPGQGPRLKPGMVLAIEPMINAGKGETRVLGDRWTVVTADGSLSAHFEHTVAVTDRGPRILSEGLGRCQT
ncbi:MAG: type I methionyl aminopeptidase [Nitrospirae bacterium RBG_16_64_22]|nr:MAG: type I methionyl aminopeptidase [Nitrospirae bacterium RBG_16_64_22]